MLLGHSITNLLDLPDKDKLQAEDKAIRLAKNQNLFINPCLSKLGYLRYQTTIYDD